MLLGYLLPLLYRNILCLVIYQLFKQLNSDFIKDREENKLSINEIGRYKKKHQVICKLLEAIDNNVHVMTGCDIIIVVIMLCLLLYICIWDPNVHSDNFFTAIFTFWIATYLVMIGFIGIGGALINHEVSH